MKVIQRRYIGIGKADVAKMSLGKMTKLRTKLRSVSKLFGKLSDKVDGSNPRRAARGLTKRSRDT